MRTIQIEDDEFDDLLSEKEDLETKAEELGDQNDDLKDRIEELEGRVEDLEGELGYFQERWDDKTELLKRIGELS